MSRTKTKRPLTGEQLAAMDAKHELKKAALIKARGIDVTAAARTPGEQRARDQRGAMGRILQEVFLELQSAVAKHGPQHSPHEGIAVLQEEVDELWDEIKADRGRLGPARKEAVQVAAMAVRYVLDNNPR
jgi:hypothetical protein